MTQTIPRGPRDPISSPPPIKATATPMMLKRAFEVARSTRSRLLRASSGSKAR